MIASPGAEAVDRFRGIVARRLGLQFDDAKLAFLGEVLQRRLDQRHRAPDAYLWSLDSESFAGEIAALAKELTVNETYFFRNGEQFRALAEIVVPERMRVQAASKVLRFLSAGCASGEEAYSIAITAREAVGDATWDVSVRAVDLNPAMLEKAIRARYSEWALRETSPELRRKWFHGVGREALLDEAGRIAVTFEEKNLAAEDSELWRPSRYDAVFCRNVTMYFTPEQARALVARIARALVPGGYLFLGHAETLRGVSDAFHLRHTHDTFYYQRIDCVDSPAASRRHATPRPADPIVPLALGSDSWVATIREASERVAALIHSPAAPAGSGAAPAAKWDLLPALDLLRQERFGDALDLVRGAPPEFGRDPDLLLLEAILHAHAGRLGAAEDTCRLLLARDEMNAGAHYVLALCRESAGDRAAAADHDRVAAYLDTGFAMPRLHLGLLARRAGDRDAGRRELTQALLLLKREDTSRILIFGGGFSREGLIALCEAELRICGGSP